MSDYQQHVVSIVSVTFGTISLICSVFTLILIYYSKKWTGYLLLLVSLTVSQIVYDFNYIFRIIKTPQMCHFTMFLDVWGGLGISFWINILAFVVAYTVVSSKPIQIFQHYYLFSIYGTLIPIVAALIVTTDPDVLSTDDSNGNSCHYTNHPEGNFFFNFYYFGRLCAIFLTIIFCTITLVRLRTMRANFLAAGAGTSELPSPVSSTSNKNKAGTRLVFVTVSRMNYYAIAQILCRSGAAWNEWKHGEYSTFASSVAAAICSPSTGILSFFIFLVMAIRFSLCLCGNNSLLMHCFVLLCFLPLQMMQPNAYKSFKKLLCCRLSRTDEEEERFKPASSIASSKAPSMYDSGSSRVSSGVRSQSTAYERESSADPEQYDTPNPIFFTSPSFQQDDWYDDEDVSSPL